MYKFLFAFVFVSYVCGGENSNHSSSSICSETMNNLCKFEPLHENAAEQLSERKREEWFRFATCGARKKLEDLLKADDSLLRVRDEKGRTELMLAAQNGHAACVKILRHYESYRKYEEGGAACKDEEKSNCF